MTPEVPYWLWGALFLAIFAAMTSTVNASAATPDPTARVLVLDGAPATKAARVLSAARPAGQPLALVHAGREATILLPPTIDAGAIGSALDAVGEDEGGSRPAAAMRAAVGLLARSDLRGGEVVLISDGRGRLPGPMAADRLHRSAFDTGTELTVLATEAGPRGRRALRRLADVSGGRFAGDAERVVAQVLATAPAPVPAAAPVVASALREADAPEPVARRAAVSDAGPPTAGLVTVLIGGLLLAAWTLLRRLHRRDDRRARIGGWSGLGAAAAEATEATAVAAVPERSLLVHGARWDRLVEALEIGRTGMTGRQLIVRGAAGTILGFYLGFALGGSALVGLGGAFVAPIALRSYVRRAVRKQRLAFARELPDALQVVASAMRTGHSFSGALELLVEDAGEPVCTEFRRVVADERLGVPFEETLGDVARRMKSRELEQVVLVTVLQRQSGGNGSEALDRVVDTVRAQEEVRQLVTTLTAQGRMSRWVMTALPCGLAAILTVLSPEYINPLFTTGAGNAILATAVGLITIGSVWIGRLVEIEV